MTRPGSSVLTITLLAGCIAPQSATSTTPTYMCTATQSCTDAGCAPSDLKFNVSGQDPTAMDVLFTDGTFTLGYVETTIASLPDGPVSLTTFQDMTTTDGMRLTLANDGTAVVRARLTLSPNSNPTDISALCTSRG